MPRLSLADDGAELHRGAAAPLREDPRSALAPLPEDAAGTRVYGLAALRPFPGADGPIVAAAILGPGCRAVRADLFDKTAATNWSLAWRQDRVIAVERRVDVEGFGPWTLRASRRRKSSCIRSKRDRPIF